jgi:hypothetical protein
MRLYLISIFAALTFSACTKVVDINLNSAAPRLIIEGGISDRPSSCTVKLSRTLNFDEPNIFPAVTGSLVVIKDEFGAKATLAETAPGLYKASSFRGIPGNTYTISITSEGKTYTAVSRMPQAVLIDTITQESYSFGYLGRSGTLKFVRIQYKDPKWETNFYRFVQKINSTVSNSIMVDNDQLREGNVIGQSIYHDDPGLLTGDTVVIYLHTIEKEIFNYFSQLREITSHDRGGQSAAPANPISNFDNGALGYFSAYAIRSKKIIIK